MFTTSAPSHFLSVPSSGFLCSRRPLRLSYSSETYSWTKLVTTYKVSVSYLSNYNSSHVQPRGNKKLMSDICTKRRLPLTRGLIELERCLSRTCDGRWHLCPPCSSSRRVWPDRVVRVIRFGVVFTCSSPDLFPRQPFRRPRRYFASAWRNYTGNSGADRRLANSRRSDVRPVTQTPEFKKMSSVSIPDKAPFQLLFLFYPFLTDGNSHFSGAFQ